MLCLDESCYSNTVNSGGRLVGPRLLWERRLTWFHHGIGHHRLIRKRLFLASDRAFVSYGLWLKFCNSLGWSKRTNKASAKCSDLILFRGMGTRPSTRDPVGFSKDISSEEAVHESFQDGLTSFDQADW